MIDQGLSGVAGDGLEGGFFVIGEGGERVGVVAEEVAEIEGVGLGLGFEMGHFDWSVGGVLMCGGYSVLVGANGHVVGVVKVYLEILASKNVR